MKRGFFTVAKDEDGYTSNLWFKKTFLPHTCSVYRENLFCPVLPRRQWKSFGDVLSVVMGWFLCVLCRKNVCTASQLTIFFKERLRVFNSCSNIEREWQLLVALIRASAQTPKKWIQFFSKYRETHLMLIYKSKTSAHQQINSEIHALTPCNIFLSAQL